MTENTQHDYDNARHAEEVLRRAKARLLTACEANNVPIGTYRALRRAVWDNRPTVDDMRLRPLPDAADDMADSFTPADLGQTEVDEPDAEPDVMREWANQPTPGRTPEPGWIPEGNDRGVLGDDLFRPYDVDNTPPGIPPSLTAFLDQMKAAGAEVSYALVGFGGPIASPVGREIMEAFIDAGVPEDQIRPAAALALAARVHPDADFLTRYALALDEHEGALDLFQAADLAVAAVTE